MKTSKTRRIAICLAGLALSVTSLTAFVVPQAAFVWHHTGIVVARTHKV